MPNRFTHLVDQRLFAEVNSHTVESVFEIVESIVKLVKIGADCILNTKNANAASEEEDGSENNRDDADNETCGTETCGLTCSSECLLTANGKNETYDCHRKCDDGAPFADEAENETEDAEYETCYSLTFHDKTP
jgi:hypothetical protein